MLKQCRWCFEQRNGDLQLDFHERSLHPVEYYEDKAKKADHQAENQHKMAAVYRQKSSDAEERLAIT